MLTNRWSNFNLFRQKQSIFENAFPVFLFLLNLLLRSLYATNQDISHDEPFSIYHAQFDIATIWNQLKNYNNPPLFEIILHFWIKLFGLNTFPLRFISIVFSSLSSVALYFLGKKFFSQRIGIISGLLLTFSSMAIYYSLDCRVYSMLMFFSITATYYYLHLANNSPKKHHYFLYCLNSIIIIYLHYFGFIVLFIHFIHLLFKARQQWKKIALVYFFLFFAYLPHLFVIATRFFESAKNGTWINPPTGIESIYNMIWSFSNSPVVSVACIALILLSFGALLLRNREAYSSNLFLITILFMIPLFGMFLLSYKIPVYIDRYLIFCLPFYYLFISNSICQLLRISSWRNAFILLFILSFTYTANYNPQKKRNVSETMSILKKIKNNETQIIVCPYDYILTFAFHYDINIFSNISDQIEYKTLEDTLKKEGVICVNNFSTIQKEVENKNYPYKYVIFIDAQAEFAAPSNKIYDGLINNMKLLHTLKFHENFILYYFIKTTH